MAQINQDFNATYAGMSDNELLRIAADKASRVDVAAVALEAEMHNRGFQ